MAEEFVPQRVMIEPGYVFVPAEPVNLCAVVASGVAVTLFDTHRGIGGMTNYLYPRRRDDVPATPLFALPAIAGLLQMLRKGGSHPRHIEASIFGGAANTNSPHYVQGLSEDNLKVGGEILQLFKIEVTNRDVGGHRGRKVVFDAGTGETMIACVDNLRSSDWYPPLEMAS